MRSICPSRDVARVLFDASNLQIGGGVQVAASLVDELQAITRLPGACERFPWLNTITYHLSPQVYDNLNFPNSLSNLKISATRWYQISRWLHSDIGQYDAQFTVFGPRYGRRYAPITITGIADGTSIYQWPEGLSKGTPQQRFKRAIRGKVSRFLFCRESFVISESASLLQAFNYRTQYDLNRSAVVPNIVNSAVAEERYHRHLTEDLRSYVGDDVVLFAYPARGYAHKNHDFLPLLREELFKLDIKAKFVLTLSDAEWNLSSEKLREASINVGPQTIHHIADLNLQCDAVIFPSLLESYSVTPLEALITNGLLFAADRSFVREVAGEAACYFDPLQASTAAITIARVLKSPSLMSRYRAAASEMSSKLPTAYDRAIAYLNIIDRLISERRGS